MGIRLYEVVNASLSACSLNYGDQSDVEALGLKPVDEVTGQGSGWELFSKDYAVKIEVWDSGCWELRFKVTHFGDRFFKGGPADGNIVHEGTLNITNDNGKYWIILIDNAFIVDHDNCLSFEGQGDTSFVWFYFKTHFIREY